MAKNLPGIKREDEFAADLGLDRKMLTALRKKHFRIGAHFVNTNNRIVYTALGIDAMKKLLPATVEKRIPPPDDDAPEGGWQLPAIIGAAVGKAAKREHPLLILTVHAVPRNTRILHCMDESENSPIKIVHVRDNSLFLKGMKIQARYLGQRLEYYGKLPRRKGIL